MALKKRILVVEDEAVAALDIGVTLQELNYEVVKTVDSGETAIEIAASLKPNLILMDIRLAGKIDGITAAKEIWDSYRIPTVFLTAYSDEATLARAKLAQPYGYLLKPFHEDELRVSLEFALNRYSAEGNQQVEQEAKKETQIEKIDFGSIQLNPAEFLKRVDPFRQLAPDELNQLAEKCEFKSFDPHQQIEQEGSQQPKCFIVAHGRVACIKSSVNGKQLIVTLLPPGDIFGLLTALQDAPFPFAATAQRESMLLMLDRSAVLHVFEKHPELYKNFVGEISSRLAELHEFACQLAHDRVEVRIASALISLMSNFSRYNRVTEYSEVDMTRQELADLVGTTPETAIRVTKDMERDALLDLTKPGLIKILNTEGLEKIIHN